MSYFRKMLVILFLEFFTFLDVVILTCGSRHLISLDHTRTYSKNLLTLIYTYSPWSHSNVIKE